MTAQEKIITQHPLLYHMAEAGTWENIKRNGLLSTKALLALFEVGEPRRTEIRSEYRRTDIPICHPEYGCAVIRKQTPMPPGRLRPALRHGEPSDWYKLLNGKVFFWSTEDRLRRFLNARPHQGRAHDVLTVCTRSLVEQYENQIKLSPINSGTVRDIRHRRCSHTFQTIADYRCKRGPECFAELAVEVCVLDIARHTLSVDRWMDPIHLHRENIWRRQPPATGI